MTGNAFEAVLKVSEAAGELQKDAYWQFSSNAGNDNHTFSRTRCTKVKYTPILSKSNGRSWRPPVLHIARSPLTVARPCPSHEASVTGPPVFAHRFFTHSAEIIGGPRSMVRPGFRQMDLLLCRVWLWHYVAEFCFSLSCWSDAGIDRSTKHSFRAGDLALIHSFYRRSKTWIFP